MRAAVMRAAVLVSTTGARGIRMLAVIPAAVATLAEATGKIPTLPAGKRSIFGSIVRSHPFTSAGKSLALCTLSLAIGAPF